MHVAVVGKGSFGKALGSILERNAQVSYVGRHESLPLACGAVFMCVPVQELRAAMSTHAEALEGKIIVQCGKGMERGSGLLPHQVVREVMGKRWYEYVALAGPSFAREIHEGRHTALTLAAEHARALSTASSLLFAPHMVCEFTYDIGALELAGTLKNAYAVVFGYTDALGCGENTRAALFVQALREYQNISKLYGFGEGVVHHGIVGDFMLSVISPSSRNYALGAALARAEKHEVPALVLFETVEGYHSIRALTGKGIATPLIKAAYAAIEGGSEARSFVEKTLSIHMPRAQGDVFSEYLTGIWNRIENIFE